MVVGMKKIMELEIKLVDWEDYFRGMGHSAGQLMDWFKNALELEQNQVLPKGTMGYDKEKGILYVEKA